MRLLLHFFAGAFLCNGVPHFVSGVMGHPFPTPFARPPGVGDSSPLANVLWGYANFLVVIAVLGRWPMAIGPNPTFIGFSLGFLAMGVGLAYNFGKVMRARAAK